MLLMVMVSPQVESETATAKSVRNWVRACARPKPVRHGQEIPVAESRYGYAIGVETRDQYCGPTGRPLGERWTSPRLRRCGLGDDTDTSIRMSDFIAIGLLKNFWWQPEIAPKAGNDKVTIVVNRFSKALSQPVGIAARIAEEV